MWLWITFQTNRTQEWLNLLQCFYNEVTIITCPYQVVACILLQYIWLSFNPYKPIHISNEFAWIRDNIYTLCVASIESLMVRKLWTTLLPSLFTTCFEAASEHNKVTKNWRKNHWPWEKLSTTIYIFLLSMYEFGLNLTLKNKIYHMIEMRNK